MSTAAGPVVCFGEVLVRLAPPGAGLLSQAHSLDVVVGGAEANVAAALASLGHDVRMITCLPENPLGDRARGALGAAGIDGRYIVRRAGRMGLYFFEQGAGLRPATITYDRAGSAFADAPVEIFEFEAALRSARLLHVSGITPALGPGGVDMVRAATAAAKAAGVPICFDGNYRGSLWGAWNGDPRAILKECVGAASILIGNHRDIGLLLGLTLSGEGAARRRAAAEAAFAAFPNLQVIASTAREVIDQAHHRISARVDRKDEHYQTESISVTGIIDRIGTGDAFAAGVVHRWLGGAGCEAMARGGLACAALKHSMAGDMAFLREQDLADFSAAGGDVKR